jgi:hypothetical protein
VILLVGGVLFDSGHSDDILVTDAGHAIHPMTTHALEELGIRDVPESGPVLPDQARVAAVRAAQR